MKINESFSYELRTFVDPLTQRIVKASCVGANILNGEVILPRQRGGQVRLSLIGRAGSFLVTRVTAWQSRRLAYDGVSLQKPVGVLPMHNKHELATDRLSLGSMPSEACQALAL
jgi:hypothetical protein